MHPKGLKRPLEGAASTYSYSYSYGPQLGACGFKPCAQTAVARSVSPRCAAVPTDASRSTRSALKASSEVGTGGPATRAIEADVLPTSPGHWDACGALGEL